MRRGIVLLLLVLCAGGCSRSFYRRQADRQTYGALEERIDPRRWPTGNLDIVPPPGSRMFDPFNPDRPPLPPDDPAAHYFMRWPDGHRGSCTFHRDGDAPFIEDPSWINTLPLDAKGRLELTPEKAVGLGILHSREYQTAREQLYLKALALTLNRFEFELHWYGTNNTVATWFGDGPNDLHTLNTASNLGFTRALTSGGQLLFDISNSFLFNFSSEPITFANTTINTTLVQPLLRHACRRIRLETLTEAERTVLYAVRDFARYRKLFYVNLTQNRNGFLSLLSQVQTVRNLEANLKNQEQTLRIHEFQRQAGWVSNIMEDQAFQSYQQSEVSLLDAKANLETALDNYKISLGLPPRIPVLLDETLLQPFQLSAPELDRLKVETDRLWADFRERNQVPTLAELQEGYVRLMKYHQGAIQILSQVEGEHKKWGEERKNQGEDAQSRRGQENFRALESQFPYSRKDLAELGKKIDREATSLIEEQRAREWENLKNLARQLVEELDQLFVLQTKVRVNLIRLKPVPYTWEEAVRYAKNNRLDLMNERGRVVDAWRQIEVTANAMKAGLDLKVTANVATPPGTANPVDFRAAASSYSAGVFFDGPLNRMAERNAYRAALISYQQQRRVFMALEDQIEAAIRADLRRLELERASFAIARQALITAAGQVELAYFNLRMSRPQAGTTATIDILNALQALLQAKSALLNNYISYESDRVQLLLDMEMLEIGPQGVPADEPNHNSLPGLPPIPAETAPGSRSSANPASA